VRAWSDEIGVDRERLMALMHDSSGQTWFGSQFDRIEFARHGQEPGNSIAVLTKDVRACLDGVGVPEEAGFQGALLAALEALEPEG
jgi:3-hydroxyisobutyrate dehydrogenase